MTTAAREPDIPGTTPCNGAMARVGYALHQMCCSCNRAASAGKALRELLRHLVAILPPPYGIGSAPAVPRRD